LLYHLHSAVRYNSFSIHAGHIKSETKSIQIDFGVGAIVGNVSVYSAASFTASTVEKYYTLNCWFPDLLVGHKLDIVDRRAAAAASSSA
jgi:hypothetical protein